MKTTVLLVQKIVMLIKTTAASRASGGGRKGKRRTPPGWAKGRTASAKRLVAPTSEWSQLAPSPASRQGSWDPGQPQMETFGHGSRGTEGGRLLLPESLGRDRGPAAGPGEALPASCLRSAGWGPRTGVPWTGVHLSWDRKILWSEGKETHAAA